MGALGSQTGFGAAGVAMGRMAWRALAAAAAMIAALGAPGLAQARDMGTSAQVTGSLKAVTCTAEGNCWAVGNNASSGPQLIEHWDGSAWQVVADQVPPGASSNSLEGVACAGAASCWAVGYYTTSSGTATLPYAEEWNGQAWSYVALPSPPPGSEDINLLTGVSCPSSTLCFAVGSYTNAENVESSLIESWNGEAWTIVPSPAPPSSSTGALLQAVSCASASDCWAAGHWSDYPGPGGGLAENWNGSQWSALAVRSAPEVDLTRVSCPGLNMCMALGQAGTTTLVPFAVRWDGSAWVVAPPIRTSGGTGLYLSGVSCATHLMCVAVGGERATLAEQWNGSAWAIVPSPNPAGAYGSALVNVTCLKVTDCWAVGDWTRATSTGTGPDTVLIEHWNGTAWTMKVS